jgi:hypothetical protein
MKPQDPRLAALLDAYRADRVPSPAARGRMERRFEETLRRGRSWPRSLAVTLVAVAPLVVLWLFTREWSAERLGSKDRASEAQAPFAAEPPAASGEAEAHGGRAATSSSAEQSPAPTAGPRPAAGAEATATKERPPRRPLPPSASSSAPSPGAREREPEAKRNDLVLIEAAEAALRAGDPARALVLLRQHEERFAQAPTAEEREALRVLSLCAAGRLSEGRGARWVFLRAHPQSAYRERIESACPQP